MFHRNIDTSLPDVVRCLHTHGVGAQRETGEGGKARAGRESEGWGGAKQTDRERKHLRICIFMKYLE